MKPDISEFSYGFALTSELVQSFGLHRAGAPLFPSLKAEGKPGGGFDVKLPGIPVFLQFKLSDYLKTSRGLEYASLGGPYYRFKIRAPKHSKQHELLLALEGQGKTVLYCAPRFHTPHELNDVFANSAVVKRSAFVRPSSIGALPDADEHSVSFTARGFAGIFRSDPRDLELTNPDELFGTVLPSRLDGAATEETSFRGLGDQLVNLYADRHHGPEADRARRLRDASLTCNEPSVVSGLAAVRHSAVRVGGVGSALVGSQRPLGRAVEHRVVRQRERSLGECRRFRGPRGFSRRLRLHSSARSNSTTSLISSLKTLYVYESRTSRSGKASRKQYLRRNRSGNAHTKSLGQVRRSHCLCPPVPLTGLDDRIYRAQRREILDRVAARENLKLGIAAEVIAALSRASLTAPPRRIELLLYSELFNRLFPTKSAALLTHRWSSGPGAYERARAVASSPALARRGDHSRDSR